MKRQLKISFSFTLMASLVLGVLYPLTVMIIGCVIPSLSPPSILKEPVLDDGLFQGRPSIKGGPSNLALTSQELKQQVDSRLKKLTKENPGMLVPRDLLFASASGYDPDISIEAARFQIPRIAKAKKITPSTLETLIEDHTKHRIFNIFGTDRVNVVELNETLKKGLPNSSPIQ